MDIMSRYLPIGDRAFDHWFGIQCDTSSSVNFFNRFGRVASCLSKNGYPGNTTNIRPDCLKPI